MKLALKDLARDLGLSTTTVSWVLAGKGKEHRISEATSERVLKYARRFNFQPNLLARSLNTGMSNTIGLIVPSVDDMFYAQLARAVEQEAELLGYALMLCSTGSEVERENRMIDTLRAKQVDGLLIAPTKQSDSRILGMMRDNYPFVLVDRYWPELDTNYVTIDCEASSYNLVKHLLSKGYRRIAVMTTAMHLHTMEQRVEGWRKAYRDAGTEPDPNLVGAVDFKDYQAGMVAMLDAMFEREPGIDAFFFTTHILAIETFIYLSERGITRKFGLAALHEDKLFRVIADHFDVAMIPVRSIGREAVRLLAGEIAARRPEPDEAFDEPAKQGLVLPCSLCLRS
ncbi:LacI family transcriptional regulator [Bacteroidia bacterium]|nr:LacI family transcriptional regulator [Bacteroidia bacterium]